MKVAASFCCLTDKFHELFDIFFELRRTLFELDVSFVWVDSPTLDKSTSRKANFMRNYRSNGRQEGRYSILVVI